ncbi:hypothetical protein FIBSPDRAFT_965556 [Athelia psychrophila]|uniref:Uncharacterized protein n=1 Tax=Athelia psychrophila TaxID=1759441 RepID=A0A165WBN2_9AGAM|nr:hypothetical protein FIBSPDRAFT_965556 [Fibularhizoctonia sp. CBS 109695]
MANTSKSKPAARSYSPAIPEGSHLRLLCFPLSEASIEGQAWIPATKAIPGSLQVHRIGSSIFMRLVGLNPQNHKQAEGEDVDRAYPPTFNVQKELIRFHHSPLGEKPWRAVLTFSTTRDSPDIRHFRTTAGAVVIHCLVGSDTLSKEVGKKLLVVIDTCLPKRDVLPVGAESATELYDHLRREQTQTPPSLTFAFTTREGSAVERELLSEGMILAHSQPIQRAVMDLLFELVASDCPARIEVCPSCPFDIDTVYGWMVAHPHSNGWQGLRAIPLYTGQRWCLLVAKCCGPDEDLKLVVLDTTPAPPDVGSPSVIELGESVGSQRVFLHPTIFGGGEVWQSGYRVLDYLWRIRDLGCDDAWNIPEPAAWESEVDRWGFRGVVGVRLEIATTLMRFQKN